MCRARLGGWGMGGWGLSADQLEKFWECRSFSLMNQQYPVVLFIEPPRFFLVDLLIVYTYTHMHTDIYAYGHAICEAKQRPGRREKKLRAS